MTAPTAAQIEALLNFLEEHRELARGSLRSVEGRARSHRLWEEITTALNAMGGCTKSIKQWQKVWTDKKYMAKKAAVAARRSAASTGGGPSTAPQLSQWELKVISIMGDGFGEPQTTARVPAFDEHPQEPSVLEPSAAVEPSAAMEPQQERDFHVALQVEEEAAGGQCTDPVHVQPGPSGIPVSHTPQRQRRLRQQSALRASSSVRDRLFRFEEQRMERDRKRNEELAGIRLGLNKIDALTMAVQQLNSLVRELIDTLRAERIR